MPAQPIPAHIPKRERPPLGVIPRQVWQDMVEENRGALSPARMREERLNALTNAVGRYICAGLNIPLAWIEEYNELNSQAAHLHAAPAHV